MKEDIRVTGRAAEILGTPVKVRHFAEHAVEAARHYPVRPFCTVLVERDQHLLVRVGHGDSVTMCDATEVWDRLGDNLGPANCYFAER